MSIYDKKGDIPLKIKSYVCTLVFASLICTYLDLWLVGKGYYAFPVRPLPGIFTVNVLFTLFILPISTFIVIFWFNRMGSFQKLLWSIILSLAMAASELYFEKLGLFAHSHAWNHIYSVFGYFIFIQAVWYFYKWLNKA